MYCLYTNHKDRYVKLPYWYCAICGCVVYESFIEVSYPCEENLKQMIFLRQPTTHSI